MRDRYKTNYFPMGYMDVGLYTDIIDQLPVGTEVDLHKDGEPLLHKDLPWMIGYAKGKGMFTHVATNGILLGRQKEKIVDSGLDLLTVSIIDHIPFESIDSFMEFKGIRKPLTQLKLYQEADLLPMADKVIKRKLHNWTDDITRKTRKPCSKLLNYAAVNWDGGYSICCVDYKREMVPFNVKDAPLENCFEFSKMLYKWQEQGVFLPPCNHCNYWEV
jgi:hypothetical protein